jgi:transposase InsO family protein
VPLYKLPISPGAQPNDVWAADFKGWFRTADGTKIDPLTITDSASRYLIRCRAVDKTDGVTVRGQFTSAFQEFGLPNAIRTDNGPPFASLTVAGLSRLSVWLIRLGVTPERIRPGHPEENGAHERMHKTLKQQTAKPPRASLRAQQDAFDGFKAEYNEQRPHESLGMKTPGEVYHPSLRPFPNRIPEIEYPSDAKVYKVSTNGCIKPRKTTDVFVSNALVGERVGLIQTNDKDWTLYFSTVRLGTLDSKRMEIVRV